jgi:hypothetical protein
MGRKRSWNLLLLIAAASVAVAGIDAALYSRNLLGADNLLLVWSLSFYVLTVMWIEADSRSKLAIYRPYDFGFLIYLILPVYLPYYLVRTRGAKGLIWLTGFITLYLLNWPLRLAIWYGA